MYVRTWYEKSFWRCRTTALCITKRVKTVKYFGQAESGKSVETRFYVSDCTKHQCAPYCWSPSSDRMWLTPFPAIPFLDSQYLRLGMSGSSWILSISETVNKQPTAECIGKGVNLKTKLQHTGMGSSATWQPGRLCYRPAVFSHHCFLFLLSHSHKEKFGVFQKCCY